MSRSMEELRKIGKYEGDLMAARTERKRTRRRFLNSEDILSDEWDDLTADQVFSFMLELKDWMENRKRGGYDCRLIEGSIAICDFTLRGKRLTK